MTNSKTRSVVALSALTVFLDIVGFSILFPLFPALLDHYLGLEGSESRVGALVAELMRLTEGNRYGVVTLFGGILGSIYSLLQFVFAPVWGGLSDRIGRRPTLLLTLVGTLVANLLWIGAGSFALLVVARLLAGCMAGNISTASAVVADATEGKERAGGMGFLGMAIGLGFIFGPILGGVFGPTPEQLGSPEDWSRGLAWHPFSLAAVASSVLALLNLALVAARLPETLDPANARGAAGARVWNPFAQLPRLAFPGVARTVLIYFLFLTAFAAMEFTLTFLAVERLSFTIRDNTWMFVFVGLVIALVQGGVVRRMAPRVGERRLTVVGLVLLLPGFLLIGNAPDKGQLYFGLTAMAVGSALAMPCLSALVSRYAPTDRQGLALGTFRSMGSLARAIGPIAGGLLYWKLGSASPYWIGALWLAIPLGLSLRLPPVPERVEAG